MFVTVKYGDDQSKLFNANCRNEVLLNHIKRRCQCERDDIVELSDESGTVKNLRNFPTDYGVEYLKEREILILLKVDNIAEENESHATERMMFVPMLSGMEGNKEFTDALNPKPDKTLRPTSGTDDDKKKGKGINSKNKKVPDKRPMSKNSRK